MWRLMVVIFILFAAAAPARADFEQGLKYFKSHDYPLAMQEWLPLAEQGHGEAQYRVRWLYYYGKRDSFYGNGIKKDYKEAFKWFSEAAAQKHLNAGYMVAKAYDTGNGVPKNHKAALRWFGDLAALGDVESMFQVGSAYDLGIGVRENRVVALIWLTLAADRGHKQALAYLRGMNAGNDPMDALLVEALLSTAKTPIK